MKPGKGTAFTRTKFKNLLNGGVVEKNIRSGEKLEPTNVEERVVYANRIGLIRQPADDSSEANHPDARDIGSVLSGFRSPLALRIYHQDHILPPLVLLGDVAQRLSTLGAPSSSWRRWLSFSISALYLSRSIASLT